ncbi:MAG: potassium channel family protein [Rikenellaceae bacterium]
MKKIITKSKIDNLALFGSVVLLVALSFEITLGDHHGFTPYYITTEGVVCSAYIIKFFVDMGGALHKRRFFWQRLPILLISLPYLAITMLCGVSVDRQAALTLGLLPIMRAIISFYRLFVRLVTAQSIDRILVAYLMVTILFTYIAALIFYDVEYHSNPDLHGLGNAIWWAWMSLTTVGAQIYPVTTLGKVLSVALPLVGMMLLPLFTSYIISLHKRRG